MKALFKNSSVLMQIFIFFLVLILGYVVTVLVSAILIVIQTGGSEDAISYIYSHLLEFPDIIRNLQFLQTVFFFIFPAIICAYIFSDNYTEYLKVNSPIDLQTVGLVILSIVVVFPFINGVFALNQQMVFPEWLKGLEEWMLAKENENEEVTKVLLYADTVWVLLYNIIIVCVLTGIGEEFIFRGVLLNITNKTIKNPHIAIWTVAVIFSAIHIQFYGFIPRLILGVYFGYLLYYTKNMWLPVIAHLVNNLIGVVLAYIYQDVPDDDVYIETLGADSTWWLAVTSFALFVLIVFKIKKRAKEIELQNLSA
ncbi:membrane protease YdiL (CAAX protease family) [Dysgonomonadaceae bacterium PH5-43]|nr:membrane protease YdiL (CAAX protease family) [Dysgonomonadaceae bacterium PH5-43]